jgi:hypothetical protein
MLELKEYNLAIKAGFFYFSVTGIQFFKVTKFTVLSVCIVLSTIQDEPGHPIQNTA